MIIKNKYKLVIDSFKKNKHNVLDKKPTKIIKKVNIVSPKPL